MFKNERRAGRQPDMLPANLHELNHSDERLQLVNGCDFSAIAPHTEIIAGLNDRPDRHTPT
jgi:hypothetical protein